MHDKSEMGEVVVQVYGCFVEFLPGLEAKKAIIDVERGVKAKERVFGLGVLTEEPAFTDVQVSIFAFRQMKRIGWDLSWRVSRKACITNRKRTGDMLSP